MSASISFEQDIQLVNDLLALLAREQTNLVMMNMDAIEAMLSEKSELLQKISVTANKRYNALAANHFEANEAGMLSWLNQQSKPLLSKAWAEFQKTLIQAKEMNRLNGVLINKHFNRNQQILSQLQGGGANAGSVYGPDGQARSQSLARSTFTA